MKRVGLNLVAALLVILSTPLASAADSLETLREEVERALSGEQEAQHGRLRRHTHDRDQAQAELERVLAQLEAERARVDELREAVEARQFTVAQRESRLKEEVGELDGVFAAARRAARDLSVRMQTSIVSAEFPTRRLWLDEFVVADSVPDLESLERLWLLIQQEILEAGRMSRFSTDVVGADGLVGSQREVVRLGGFSGVAEGDLVVASPGSEALRVLPVDEPLGLMPVMLRRPPPGFELLPLDPSRGQLTAVVDSTPSPQERLEQGGVIGYTIVGVGIAGLLLGAYRAIYLMVVASRVRRQLREPTQPRSSNPLGRVLSAVGDPNREDAELEVEQVVVREMERLRAGETLVRFCAAVAPLLGLLGTVTGMIVTFQTISAFGTTEPKLMAGGISQALVTTALGLLVAIPLLLMHSYLSARSRRLITILNEQALGLITLARRAGA